LVLGLSYCKYSFSPALFLYLVMQRRYRVLAISLLPPTVGLAIMWRLVYRDQSSLLAFAMEPFAVSRVGVTNGMGDLMVLLRTVTTGILAEPSIAALTYLAALVGSAGVAWGLARQRDGTPQRAAAGLATGSLMCFTHLTYDHVFLVIPLAACLSGRFHRPKALALAAIGYLWYVIKVLPHPASGPGVFAQELLAFLMLA